MTQDAGEPITSYAARLKGQARLCGFNASVKCVAPGCNTYNKIDFTETVVMGDIVRGLADPEVKTIVLGEVEQKTDLNELIKLIQAKEYAKLSGGTSSAVVTTLNENKAKDFKKCQNCNTEHFRGAGWREHCPAHGKKCNKCRITGHFAIVCRSKNKKDVKGSNKKANNVEEESDNETNAIEETLGFLFSVSPRERKAAKKNRQREKKNVCVAEIRDKPISHLVWDGDDWIVKPNKRAPLVTIRYKLCEDGYAVAKRTMPVSRIGKDKSPVTATISAMADTGCTTMVAGLSFVQHLGLKKEDLLPVKTLIKAANKTALTIIGALIVEICINSGHSDEVTKQVVYITSSTDKVFLNREACEHLKLIPESFPTQNVSNIEEVTCDCPIRSMPPPMPEKMPFPSHEKGQTENMGAKEICEQYI